MKNWIASFESDLLRNISMYKSEFIMPAVTEVAKVPSPVMTEVIQVALVFPEVTMSFLNCAKYQALQELAKHNLGHLFPFRKNIYSDHFLLL
ncbi:hypothetical protein TNCV_939071 [Trichonephila clavipes]|nr:hypothetical protein TNCV_939071 [Trichonephila clavipes]